MKANLLLEKLGQDPTKIIRYIFKKSKKRILYKKASHSKIKNYNFVNGQVIDKDKKKAYWLKQLIMQYG